MPTTGTARIANDRPFCEAYAAMDKIVERLLTMAGEGATADDATRLLASDGTALLRDLIVVDPNVLPLKCASAAMEAGAGCHG
jgi:hypothetical protein